ncbi:lysozyme [Actinoplanes sp. NPDC049596]|uniref:lysozyme n=1 Tax=unclassified Actinoplanes TaxID=2626549 RepID=UPI0034167439
MTARSRLASVLTVICIGASLTVAAPAAAATVTYGQDVASHQGNVNWPAQWNAGSRFAYVKATEGGSYVNPYFAQQYNGSYNVGMIRGAYHFALPNRSSGAAQADFFAARGGGWSADGRTLPGALDIEYNPYAGSDTCYGLNATDMRNWIAAFLNRYHARTGRWAVIYTTTDWWQRCTGDYSGFWANSPLWLARYASAPGVLPAGAPTWSFWQYSSSGPFAGDSNQWHGALDRLRALACNGGC